MDIDGRDALHELHHAELLKLQRPIGSVAHPTSQSRDWPWTRTRSAQGPDMPKLSELMPSKYLKKEDLDEHDGELRVTITKIKQQNIAKESEPEELRWLLKFAELDKPMVLNSTNAQLCAKACASDDTDDWIGRKVILYVDPNVSFGGKVVGGLRIKAVPKKKPVMDDDEDAPPRKRTAGDDDDEPAPRKKVGSMSDTDDEIPF